MGVWRGSWTKGGNIYSFVGQADVCHRLKLLAAGLGVLCLLTACAGKEQGETSSGQLWGEAASRKESGEEAPTGESPEPSAAGEIGMEPPVLADVLYDEKWAAPEPVTLQFVYSDGSIVEKELDDTYGGVAYCESYDLTGDGINEIVVNRSYAAGAVRYGIRDIFQVEGKEIRQLFPTDDIEELRGRICDTDIFDVDRKDRKGYGLYVRTYSAGIEPGQDGEDIAYAVEEMDLFYEDGRWIRLPDRELRVEVSLESDSREAGAYEAFLRGECEAFVSEQYYDAIQYMNPVPSMQEGFFFRDVLDTIVSGVKKESYTDGLEGVECALIDCGSDEKLELAVRVSGLSIYSRHDNSCVYMIFQYRDNRVELIYSVDTWARSDTTIYRDGFIFSGGSGGAGTHNVSEGIIGADGMYREYSMDIETGQGLYSMTRYRYMEDTIPAEFYECTFGEEKIYAYYILEDTPQEVREKLMAYIAENEEIMDVKFLTSEELDVQLERWAESCGITKQMRERSWDEEMISWQTVGGCEDYLYE